MLSRTVAKVFYYHCYSGWQDIVSTSLSMYHASDILAARVWSWPVGVKCTKGFLGRIWVLFIAVLLCPLMILRNGMAGSYDVTVVYQNGLPVISVRLPSRRERCQFTLKPISDSVGVFLRQLQEEDRGIDRVAIYSPDGVRVAASTGIDLLLLDDFKLVINDLTYHVRPPKRDLLSHENAATLNDVKTLVQQLYTTLCIEQHQLSKERELIERLEDLKEQLAPLEKVRLEISRKAEKRTTLVLWGGLAYMATQFGILARLTWWEYSWDIMEPVTYFITYGSAMAMYAYFVVTRQEYVYPEARDRQYLLFFHKGAKKSRFDLEKYNKLKDAIAQAEMDLKRLRDPLQVHLPLRQIGEKN
ncbi:calcium uniporter protein, mitochondrial isoform X3 [Pipistrellus kuhlii]|uniref:calcium uniporter protein, mitochondrial isoform X3 n=1 Tax=Pipistrellus kuhlii TaxID=59472 RepID=UPI00174F0676|nr:calcium uniporter protein, mitochondrial isoform X3 [Pipistrellus kuhlii]